MKIVDSHAHIWGKGFVPPAFFRRAADQWAAKAPDRTPGMIMPKLLSGIVDETGDDFIANMDRASVYASLIMMLDVGEPVFGEEPETSLERQIEFYAELQQRHRGRLFCHVAVDFRRSNHLDLIRRAVIENGFVGIGEITPDGFSIADDTIRPMMKLASDLGIPVQLHTRTGVWTDLSGTDFSEDNTVHPIHVARLARDLPDLKVVLCHAGFPHWWHAAGSAIIDLPNCVLDISNWNEDFHENEGELVARLATWRSLVGIDRILFASDQPSGVRFTGDRSTLREWVAFIRDLPINAARWGYRFTTDEAEAILGRNAARFYNLPEQRS